MIYLIDPMQSSIAPCDLGVIHPLYGVDPCPKKGGL